MPLITAGQIVEEAVNFPLMAEDPTTPDKIAATFAENVMVVWRDKNGRWLWAIEPYAQVNVSTVTRVDLFAVASGVAGRLRSAKMQEEGAADLGSVDILPQQDASGDEMDEGEIAARQFFEAGEDATVVLHEAEQVLDLVALLVELPVGRALVDARGFGGITARAPSAATACRMASVS